MRVFSTASVISFAICGVLLGFATSVSAEPLHKGRHHHAIVHSHRDVTRVKVVRPTPVRTISTVSTVSLPLGFVSFLHEGETFYYSDGVYYQRQPKGFVIVKPRIGFRVATLPRGYTVVREGGATFYRANNVRYKRVGGFYIVV